MSITVVPEITVNEASNFYILGLLFIISKGIEKTTVVTITIIV